MIFLIATAAFFGIIHTVFGFHSFDNNYPGQSFRNNRLNRFGITSINIQAMPKHVAYIVDGNGRWATKKGLSRIDGHRVGANVTVDVVKKTFESGVEYVTLYLFSTENWRRPDHEIQNIMILMETYLMEFSSYLKENKISLKTIGQTHRLPPSLRKLLEHLGSFCTNDETIERTLCLAISYGGRDDIVQACKQLAQTVVQESSSIDMITEEIFAKHTSTGRLGIPDPDLIIRTSGEFRVSNFLLWQCAYAEFAIVDKLWPDFGTNDCLEAIESFNRRDRRFGSTGFTTSAAALIAEAPDTKVAS